ncbi:MAG TPA: hypothetical protein VFL66_13155 [Gaiellaceae bacterium]|nr:hypothetical protein [Gaiellaceae bacterium]
MTEPGFDLLAASLRADAGDVRAFVDALATKLEGAFPGRTKVERRGGFLSGPKRVRRIEVELGDGRFELDHDDGSVGCARRSVVRGITLKSERLELDAWIDELSRALAAEAKTTGRERETLERLLS